MADGVLRRKIRRRVRVACLLAATLALGSAATLSGALCRGEGVESPVRLSWVELGRADRNLLITESLAVSLVNTTNRSISADLALVVRVDGEAERIPLGRRWLRPGAADALATTLPAGLLHGLEFSAQIGVVAVLHDEHGEFLGSVSTPYAYAHMDGGRIAAYTEDVLRERFRGGDLRGAAGLLDGKDVTVVSVGRARLARPEDLHGDPEDER